jgi:hypothetical protein
MIGIALLFGKIILRSDDEPEIANAGSVESWGIDFVEDTVADRKPNPALCACGGPDRTLRA